MNRRFCLLVILHCVTAVTVMGQHLFFEAGFGARYQRMNEIAAPLYQHFVSAENKHPRDALGGQGSIGIR
jgi:hypothetical protein